MDMTKKSEKTNGFVGRVAGWGFRKVRNPEISAVSRKTLTGGISAARESITPVNLDLDEIRAGLKGRYEDGGAARFLEIMTASGIDEDQLPDMASRHRRQAAMNLAIALLVAAVSFAMILTSGTRFGILGGAGFSIFSLAFLSLSIRSDFSAWRITERRMDGFKSYLDHRFA
jgi:hypothetical protein